MYWHPNPAHEDDGLDEGLPRRPDAFYEPGTLAIDTGLLVARRDRHRRMQEEHKDHILVAVTRSEIDFAQMYYTPVPLESPTKAAPWRPGKSHWRVVPSQFGFYMDEICIAHSGRECGKTQSMRQLMPQRMIAFAASNAIFTSFDQDHVDPRFRELFDILDAHPFFSLFVDRSDGSRRRRHPQFQRMLNGFEIHGISGGTTEQASSKVESPHCNMLFADEFQRYSPWAWRKIQNSINDLRSNRKFGACLKIHGVNSEGRIDTPFYEQAHRAHPRHRYTVASWDTPRYKIDKHVELLRELGGSIHASEFKTQIRGLTGERTRGVFPEEDIQASINLHQSLSFGPGVVYRMKRVSRKLWESTGGNVHEIFSRWFVEPENVRECVFSADYGETNPTELGIWYEMDHPTQTSRTVWALMARVEIINLPGNLQAEIFDYLMDALHPRRCSIDSTGSTGNLWNILTDRTNDTYNAKGYESILYPAKMNGDVEVRYSFEKPHENIRCRKTEINGSAAWAHVEDANVFATTEVARLMREGRLALPDDDAMRRELMTLMARTTPTGQIRYIGNAQHNVSMLRCMALLLHEDVTLEERRRDLLDEWGPDATVGEYFQANFGGFAPERPFFS